MEEIVIIHTNDLHSHLENWPKMRRYMIQRQQELQAANKCVITVDLGDFSDRVHPLTEATNGQGNTLLMNQINYDAATIGNNEGIGNSKAELDRLYDHANFPVVLGNLFEPDTGKLPSWAVPSKIIKTPSGTRIGLLGLTAPFPLTYEPNGWKIKQPVEVLPQLLATLANQTDMIVLMSHLGIDEDNRLAKAFPQLDIILGSHTHHLFSEGKLVNQSLLAAAGKFGRYLGEVSIKMDKQKIIEKKARVIATENLFAQPEDQMEVANYVAAGKKGLAEKVKGYLPISYYHALGAKPQVIDLGLAALKQQTGSEVVILNSGLFLTDLKAGLVNEDDLHECLPHPMHLLRVTLSGEDLLSFLGEVTLQADELREYPIVGMGFRGKIFGEIASLGLTWSKDLSDILWQGRPLEMTKKYTFVTVDHLLFIPFFPTIKEKAEIQMIFPDFLRTVVGKYLSENYPFE